MFKTFKRYLIVILAFVLIGIGSAIAIKANMGLGAWDAIANTVAYIFNMKIGTVGIIFNCSCIVGQIIIYRSKFRPICLLQLPAVLLLGSVINFVYYNLFTFSLDSMVLRFIFCVLSLVIIAFAVSIIMLVDAITCPLEAFCMALTNIVPFKFHILRQMADVICILLVFILTFIFKIPLTVGIGTIIGMLIFGPMLGLFMRVFKPLLEKMNLLK